jgi:retinol dehydrogenase-14
LLLLDILKSTAKFDVEARIVVISSAIWKQARSYSLPMDTGDIQLLKPGSYTGSIAYENSKTASVLFALELHKRLEGSGVTCNVVNPGRNVRSTGLFRNQGCLRRCIFSCFRLSLGTSLTRAAGAVVFVATDSELSRVSGRCFAGSDESAGHFETRDFDLAKQLWDLSKTMVNDFL